MAPDFASRPATFESELWRSLATVSLALLQRDVPAEDAAANSGDTDSGCCRLCGRSPPQSPPATSRSFAVRCAFSHDTTCTSGVIHKSAREKC